MGWRRFEYREGELAEFWEIEIEGERYTLRFGEIDRPHLAQTQVKRFSSRKKARAKARTKVAGKLARGFVEVEIRDAVEESEQQRQLERALCEDLDDPMAWQVFGDWLVQRGDPHGELILLGLQRAESEGEARLRLDARIAELEQEHRQRWLGGTLHGYVERAQQVRGLSIELGERHGYILRARISGFHAAKPRPDRVARTLLKAPAAGFLREFDIDYGDPEGLITNQLRALDELPALRVARIGVYRDSYAPLLLAKAPRLQELTIWGNASVDALEHPRLERLRIMLGSTAPWAVHAFALPNLRSLTLSLWRSDFEGSGPLLTGVGLPKLERLGLVRCERLEELLPVIAASPLLQRVRVLDLSDGHLGPRGVPALLALARSFAQLEQLELQRNMIPQQAHAQLREALPNTRVGLSDQQEVVEDEDGEYYSPTGE